MIGTHSYTPFVLRSDEKGMVLVAVVLLMSLFALVSTTAVLSTRIEFKLGNNYRSSQEVIYIAQGGAEYGLNRLRSALQVLGGDTGSVVPPMITGFTFENTGSFLALSGSAVQKPLTGQFAGLTALTQRYVITSSVVKNNTNVRAAVAYEVEDQLIPLFQFGIFFDHDLEILPEEDMTFTGGPIHSNSDIYLFPDGTRTLSIDSVVTTAGGIIHNRKDSSPGTAGTVRIKDAGGTYQPLTIESSTPAWRADALSTWNGRVKSAAHDIQSLNLPLPSGGNPIDLLGTGSQGLRQKSGLKITTYDGDHFTARDKDGDTITLPAGLVSKEIFYDWREYAYMTAVEIDISKLTGAALAALNNPPAGGQAGILYVSSAANRAAVRLVDGANLPAGGLSVVTNNPLYIQGDFNTGNLPSAIFADAVTVLSNNWNDANSNKIIFPFMGWRTASNTTVKTAIMAGNKDTAGVQYSGGVDNFIRLLENWSGKTLTYSGSLTCLWQSQQATGNWRQGGSFSTLYREPVRNWSYGIVFANLPPGTPYVRSVQRVSWKQALN